MGLNMNNYENLKNMTIEELAEFLDGVQVDAIYGNGSTAKEWLSWLLCEA